MKHSVWLPVVAAACTASPTASATPNGNPPAVPSPPPVATALAEVVPAAQKTSLGGDVVVVGVPRFQLASDKGFGPLVLRSRAHTVFAEDLDAIVLWDAVSGAPLKHIAPRLDAYPAVSTSLAVSDDGDWLATGSSFRVRIFHRPFDQATGELSCYRARAFSHDAKLLACEMTKLEVWDVAKRQRIVPLPASAPKDRTEDVRFAPDNRSLVWTSERGVLRWDFAGNGAVSSIYQATGRIDYSKISEDGTAAYVTVAGKAMVVDLATGKTADAPSQFGAVLSPSGKRLALYLAGAVQMIELATGKPVWSSKVSTPVSHIAFGDGDDSLVYVESQRLRVAKLPGGPAVQTSPPRFAGWLGNGVAAIERDDVLRGLTLATQTWSPADRSALARRPADRAPAWATWIGDDVDAATAAEPSKRRAKDLELRGDAPCEPKLRVWTTSGGVKTLTMNCTKSELDGHEDPGWEIAGGWAAGVSATVAAIYDARSGRRVAALELPRRKSTHPEFAAAYWQAALAPAGDWLALIWRQPELQGASGTERPDPREDAMHVAEAAANVDCVNGDDHGCQLEYFLELWNVKGTPKRVLQTRLERVISGRQTPEPAAPSGALTFDPSGGHLLLGLNDGQIRVLSTAAPTAAPQVEHLHSAPIRLLSVDPNGTWSVSGDAAGEQRLWRLTP